MPALALKASGLSKWFGAGAARTWAVRQVSFEAYLGEMLYVVGPSGSGKTTLLSMVCGILEPDEGAVHIRDVDVWRLPDNRLSELRLNTIGFVFQDYHLFPRLSTLENVALPLILRRRPWKEALGEAGRFLDTVGLGPRGDLPPGKLSGGEQQRVAIARAMVGSPDLLVFDEPTASLDGETGRRIIQFVATQILNDRRCIVIVTHDSRIFEYAHRIMHMEDGRITQISPGGPRAQ